jgi:hypothetical protein
MFATENVVKPKGKEREWMSMAVFVTQVDQSVSGWKALTLVLPTHMQQGIVASPLEAVERAAA